MNANIIDGHSLRILGDFANWYYFGVSWGGSKYHGSLGPPHATKSSLGFHQHVYKQAVPTPRLKI